MKYLKTYESLFDKMLSDKEMKNYLEKEGVLDFYREKLPDTRGYNYICFFLVDFDGKVYNYAYALYENSQYLREFDTIEEIFNYYPDSPAEKYTPISRGPLRQALVDLNLNIEEGYLYNGSFPPGVDMFE